MTHTTQAAKDAANIQNFEEQRAKNRHFLTLATRDHKAAEERLAGVSRAVRMGDYSREAEETDAKILEAEEATKLAKLQNEDERLMHALAPIQRRGVVAEKLARELELDADAQDVILGALANGHSEEKARELAQSIRASQRQAAGASLASYQRETDVEWKVRD